VAVTAALEREGDTLRVVLRNDDDAPVTFSTAAMVGSPAFELVDEAGRPVPLGPPPTPPADLRAGLVTLAPGGTTALAFDLMALLPDGVGAGGHRLRFAGTAPPLEGAWSGCVLSPWIAVQG
jgi:hypothetical protein